jgi:hypothetical protein
MEEKRHNEKIGPKYDAEMEERFDEDKGSDNIIGLVEWDEWKTRPQFEASLDESERNVSKKYADC